MPTLQEQFQHQPLDNHFEDDPHLEVQGLGISGMRVLHGETAEDDVLAVEYEGSPALSFYDTRGRLIDVDHYLPDHYIEADQESSDKILKNLPGTNSARLSAVLEFKPLLQEVFEIGGNSISRGLQLKFGLESTALDEVRFREKLGMEGGTSADFMEKLADRYPNMVALLRDYLGTKMTTGNGYVHFTPRRRWGADAPVPLAHHPNPERAAVAPGPCVP